MKKWIAVVLAVVMVMAMAACGKTASSKPALEGTMEEIANKVNRIFEKFYESEGVRQQRFNARMSTSYTPYFQGIDRATMDRIDSMRMAILREVSNYGKQLDRAIKDKEKAFKTRDSYSSKLDYMRDSRDDYRQRYQEQRKRSK